MAVKLHRTLAATLAVLTACTGAAGESEDDEKVDEQVDEVLVSTSRIGVVDQRVVVLDDSDVDRVGFHPSDLLQLLPGFALATSGSRGALSQARVRGAEANHLLVKIDGVTVNDPAAGSEFDFGGLGLVGINGVEFLAGPQSAVWGSDAIAGVLHFETTPRANRQRLRIGYGSHATATVDFSAARARADGHVQFALGHVDSGGTNTSLQGNENDGFTNTTAHLGVGHRNDSWELSFVGRATEAESAYDPTPAPLYVPVDGDRASTARSGLVGATARFVGHRDIVPWLTVSSTRTDREQAADGVVDTTTTGRRDSAALSANGLYDRQRFNITIEHTAERFEQTGEATAFGDPNHSQRITTVSLAGEYQADLPVASITVSARRDANSAFRDALSYRLGATTRTSPRWFASVGRGVKNPTFIERFGYSPNAFVGNPDLLPETSLGVELGVAQSWPDAALTLVVFDASLDDEINGFAFDADAGGFTARNIVGTSRRHGAELTFDASWRGTHWRAAYAYIDSTSDDGQEIRRPRHLGNLGVHRPLSPTVSVGAALAYYGRSLDQDFSTFPATTVVLDGFRTLRADLKIQPTHRWGIQMLVENALDTEYSMVHGYRGPGLSAMVRAELHL